MLLARSPFHPPQDSSAHLLRKLTNAIPWGETNIFEDYTSNGTSRAVSLEDTVGVRGRSVVRFDRRRSRVHERGSDAVRWEVEQGRKLVVRVRTGQRSHHVSSQKRKYVEASIACHISCSGRSSGGLPSSSARAIDRGSAKPCSSGCRSLHLMESGAAGVRLAVKDQAGRCTTRSRSSQHMAWTSIHSLLLQCSSWRLQSPWLIKHAAIHAAQ